MRRFFFVAIGLLIVVAGVLAGRAIHIHLHPQAASPPVVSAAQPASSQAKNPDLKAPSTAAAGTSESANHLGPFTIAGRNYTVELQTRKVQSNDEQGDTVMAMEIRDATGAMQYRRTFPYVEAKGDFFESWSVSAQPLIGANGTGLLVSYDDYSEPSAPEEEPTGWFQIFGEVNEKLVPFGAPLQLQGGLLSEYSDGHAYKAAKPLDAHADAVEVKVWTGHCRLIFPIRVDWAQGKLSPAQECAATFGELGAGCEYRIVPEDKFYREGITFVRLWPSPNEKSGQPTNAVVKKDSKVDLVTALIATKWAEGNPAGPSANSKYSMDDAGGFGVAADNDLWLKVRIDGKEGWMHSEEDFRALGLPEDE